MDKEDKDFLAHSQREQKDLEASMKESFRQRDERKQKEVEEKLWKNLKDWNLKK